MIKTRLLILLMGLMILCADLSSCASSVDIYIKGKDYDYGTNNNEPKDRSTWMWITYPSAKKRLHWLNHK